MWNPKVRRVAEVDFEDWRKFESDEVWIEMIPAELTNGTDPSYAWFMYQADLADQKDKNPMMEDFWLRKAAQRGSALAMMLLGFGRSALQHDQEALRWFRRVRFLLADPGNETKISEEARTKMFTDAIKNAEICVHNGANPLESEPQDVGVKSLGALGLGPIYCLVCGSSKVPSAPPEQCDDSVHLVSRHFGS